MNILEDSMVRDASATTQLRNLSPNTIHSLTPCPQTDIYGIVTDFKTPKQSNFGRRDYMMVVGVRDPTGYIRMNMFNADPMALPVVNQYNIGDIFVAKHMKINFFNGVNQGISTQASLLALIKKTDLNEMYRISWLNQIDHKIIMVLNKWREDQSSGTQNFPRPVIPSSRPRLEVQAIGENTVYFDIVLQVVGKSLQTHNRTQVYLTDYTINPRPPTNYLESGLGEYVDNHLIIEGTFWDNQGLAVSGIEDGEIVLIRNCVKTNSIRNELEFNCRGTKDIKANVQKLRDDDPTIQPLLQRKNAYMTNREEQRYSSQAILPSMSSQPQPVQTSGYTSTPMSVQTPRFTSTPMSLQTPGFTSNPMSVHTPVPSYVPFSHQLLPKQTPVSDQMEVDDIRTEVRDIDIYRSLDKIYNTELGSRFYTRAAILDYQPKNFKKWLKKFCSNCKKSTFASRCLRCKSELENSLVFSLLLQDPSNNLLVLNCFGEPVNNLFPNVHVNSLIEMDNNSIEVIKYFIETTCPIVSDRRPYLDFGIESYQVNERGRGFRMTNTVFAKDV